MAQAFLSRDGAAIVYERTGHGPPVVIVNGALEDRTASRELATNLAPAFSVYAYDRRGRGSSGWSGDGSIDREIEDLDGLLEIIGSPVFLFGASSGANLALEATLRGLEIERLALLEPLTHGSGAGSQARPGLAARLEALIGADRAGDAVIAYYREALRLPDRILESIRRSDDWVRTCSLAHTLPYDAAIVSRGLVAEHRLAIETPVLVLTAATAPAWMSAEARDLASAIPTGEWATVEDEDRMRGTAVASKLIAFFGASAFAAAH
jgi:pimeloyl-ACP methyl ester carboxylesterase